MFLYRNGQTAFESGALLDGLNIYKWCDSLSHSLADLGFQKLEADRVIFFAHVGDHIVVLAIHVDDCTITGSSVSLQNNFKARIAAKFKLTDLGPILWLLGFAITRESQPRRTCANKTTGHML